jgi:hypothetical protein
MKLAHMHETSARRRIYVYIGESSALKERKEASIAKTRISTRLILFVRVCTRQSPG